MALPCFSYSWYQQSCVLNSLKAGERRVNGLRSAQRVFRCLPHRWLRSQIKGGKEGSFCSQTPWCSDTSGALAPPLDAHSLILKSWEVSVVWEKSSEDFFFSQSGWPKHHWCIIPNHTLEAAALLPFINFDFSCCNFWFATRLEGYFYQERLKPGEFVLMPLYPQSSL